MAGSVREEKEDFDSFLSRSGPGVFQARVVLLLYGAVAVSCAVLFVDVFMNFEPLHR